mmetsp:Transcript_47855/g.136690  ORF Transcript_47855/g.136690 Transcript_47855/m.136690 type:complete len:212 (+) Transcript_47855:112-747(+)
MTCSRRWLRPDRKSYRSRSSNVTRTVCSWTRQPLVPKQRTFQPLPGDASCRRRFARRLTASLTSVADSARRTRSWAPARSAWRQPGSASGTSSRCAWPGSASRPRSRGSKSSSSWQRSWKTEPSGIATWRNCCRCCRRRSSRRTSAGRRRRACGDAYRREWQWPRTATRHCSSSRRRGELLVMTRPAGGRIIWRGSQKKTASSSLARSGGE